METPGGSSDSSPSVGVSSESNKPGPAGPRFIQRRLQEQETEIKSLKAECLQLQKRVQSWDNLRETEIISALTAQCQELNDTVEDFYTRGDEIAALKTDCETLKETIQSLQSQDNRKEHEITALRTECQTLKETIQSQNNLREQEITVLRAECQTLKETIQSRDNRREHEITALKAECQGLKETFQSQNNLREQEISQITSLMKESLNALLSWKQRIEKKLSECNIRCEDFTDPAVGTELEESFGVHVEKEDENNDEMTNVDVENVSSQEEPVTTTTFLIKDVRSTALNVPYFVKKVNPDPLNDSQRDHQEPGCSVRQKSNSIPFVPKPLREVDACLSILGCPDEVEVNSSVLLPPKKRNVGLKKHSFEFETVQNGNSSTTTDVIVRNELANEADTDLRPSSSTKRALSIVDLGASNDNRPITSIKRIKTSPLLASNSDHDYSARVQDDEDVICLEQQENNSVGIEDRGNENIEQKMSQGSRNSQKLELDSELENAPCAVCDEVEVEPFNNIVFCDKCDVPVHQACYGVQVIPTDKWYCNPCRPGSGVVTATLRCCLCNHTGGALKPVSTPAMNKWAHVLCAWWIPELTMGDPKTQEPVMNLSKISPARLNLTCTICKSKFGAKVQCHFKRCATAFHVTCARKAGLRLKMQDPGDNQTLTFEGFCKKHS